MKVTEKDVAHMADLASLDLTESERQRMLHDLNSVLDFMDIMSEVDTSNVQPISQTSAIHVAEVTDLNACADQFPSAMRLDAALPGLSREDALRNAPRSDGVLFKVPKVIEK